MSVLYLVVPMAMVIVAGAVWAYVWAARSGQMDDLHTPAIRMLHDDPSAGGTAAGRAPGRAAGSD